MLFQTSFLCQESSSSVVQWRTLPWSQQQWPGPASTDVLTFNNEHPFPALFTQKKKKRQKIQTNLVLVLSFHHRGKENWKMCLLCSCFHTTLIQRGSRASSVFKCTDTSPSTAQWVCSMWGATNNMQSLLHNLVPTLFIIGNLSGI